MWVGCPLLRCWRGQGRQRRWVQRLWQAGSKEGSLERDPFETLRVRVFAVLWNADRWPLFSSRDGKECGCDATG